jgi:hypothetical protein
LKAQNSFVNVNVTAQYWNYPCNKQNRKTS